ncbi:winged helix-turn-helix transcriptional regulator [Rothia santali]|uniref:winged helix-turn-helix transcriptional regulator n=1 Tax=Rothia santali TaxID=2949643 RepID=UPI00359F59B6
MALRTDLSKEPCPIARAADVLGDPWTLLVLRELLLGQHTYASIRASLALSDRTLASRLDWMRKQGLIMRRPYTEKVRPRYEYHLAAAGKAALGVMNALALWGKENTNQQEGEGIYLICRSCGESTRTAELCSECGQYLTVETIGWFRTETLETPS